MGGFCGRPGIGGGAGLEEPVAPMDSWYDGGGSDGGMSSSGMLWDMLWWSRSKC